MTKQDENPLLVFEQYTKIIVGCFVLTFFFVNGLMLAFGESGYFQRLGSLWVAILLLSFGLMKFVTDALPTAVKGQGPFANVAQDKLAPVTFSESKGWRNYVSKDGLEHEHRLHTREEIFEHMQDASQRVIGIVAPNELFVGALATLQWGYGDLFHCWINGKGWTTC